MKFNNKNIKKVFAGNCFILLFLFIISLPLFSNAATYTLLEPIAGGPTSISSGADIGNYIKTIYNYILGLTVALSVLMLVVGGVEYTMTFASESQAGSARNRMTNAITGLIIALVSYVVLNTISPGLVTMELPNATGSCSATPETTGGSSSQSSSGTGGSSISGSGPGSNLGGGNSEAAAIKKLAGSRVPNQNMAEITNIYGQPGDKNQETTVTFQGKQLEVNKKAAEAFKQWSADIDAENAKLQAAGQPTYDVKQLGGFSYRQNANKSSETSLHSYGIAVDINEKTNGNMSKTTDMPDWFIKSAYKNGFRWGGEFPPNSSGVTDPMHFEYIGGGGFTEGKNGKTITSITPKDDNTTTATQYQVPKGSSPRL